MLQFLEPLEDQEVGAKECVEFRVRINKPQFFTIPTRLNESQLFQMRKN